MRSEIIQDFGPCNQDCVFCNAPDIPPGLNTQKTKETIEAYLKDGVEKIIFSGGEPTLRKDLPEIIRYAKEHGAKEVELYTNAVRCDSLKYTRQLVDAGLDAAFVALHHHSEFISDLLTRAPGTFVRTVRGLHNLNRLGVSITINTVTNAANYKDMKKFAQFVIKRFPYTGVISFSFVMSGRRAIRNPAIVPRMSDAAPYLMEAYEVCIKNKMEFNNPMCGVPICFVPLYYRYCSEYQALKQQRFEIRLAMKRNETEKTQLPVCSRCFFNEYCLGVWKNYITIHGAGEVKPVLGEPPVIHQSEIKEE